jgi:hypothetical protein
LGLAFRLERLVGQLGGIAAPHHQDLDAAGSAGHLRLDVHGGGSGRLR